MASVVDIKGIKDQIKSNLDTENTSGSSVRDLSENMSSRVKKIFTVNPEMLPIQSTFYPCVTIFTERKTPTNQTIAKDQLSARRQCDLLVIVSGMIYNPNFITDITEDPADDDCEYLMENIEYILRNDPTLSGKVKWQNPIDITYHSSPVSEQSHLRVGVMELYLKLHY